MTTKYRVKEDEGFYPQVKGWFFWKYFQANSWDSMGNQRLISTCFDTEEKAMEFIDSVRDGSVKPNGPVHHLYRPKDAYGERSVVPSYPNPPRPPKRTSSEKVADRIKVKTQKEFDMKGLDTGSRCPPMPPCKPPKKLSICESNLGKGVVYMRFQPDFKGGV